MKTFSPGLSDSIASVIDDPRPCPHCDSSSHIAGGLCVGCLLEAGLDPADESADSLDALLSEINLPDQNWRLGNYEILEEIGRGGMGVIYRARQRHSRRIVAVKRILSYHSDSRETLARFRREAQAAASLDHPNILPIYEVSESEDGLPFFSMKFAPGGTLQQVAPALRNEPRQCVALVAKIARAVQYAHSRGILHRDLKPGNILLDGRGEPLVSDFGLAKWLDTTSDLTRTLTIFGTPGYIAPEQASGDAAQLKPTADVYSLGAILFDLLAGRPPFLGAHALSVIRQAAESPAPKLRTLSKVADRDLETICSRCLERDPTARYHSAHNLAEDLELWLQGRPIIARPVSPPARIWRWSRRNPILAGAAGASLLLGGYAISERIASSRLSSIVQDAEIARRSIVVVPFEDLDALSSSSNAAQAVTDALTAALRTAKSVQLRGPADQSAGETDPWRPEDWKTIGQITGARLAVTGSVRHRDRKNRVAIHLIETKTGLVISTWLQDAKSNFEIGEDSLKQVAEFLNTKRDAAPRNPHSPNLSDQDGDAVSEASTSLARSYFDRGEQFLSRFNLVDLDRAIESFRKAIEIDHNYAVAYAMLASACQARAQIDPTGPWLAEAESAVARALEISPMLPEGHRARAGTLRRRGQMQASIDSFLTAYELDPANGRTAALLGDVYDQIGRPDLAIGWFEKATHRLTQPFFADNIGNAWTSLGEYDKAAEAYEAAIIFKPDLPVGLLGLSRLAVFRGDYETARDKCEQARAKYGQNPEPLKMAALIEFFDRNFSRAEKFYREALIANHAGGVDFASSVRYLSAIGFIRKHSNAEEANQLLEEVRALDEKELTVGPNNLRRLYSLAANYAAQTNREAAIANLNKAIAAGWIDYPSMLLDPRFDGIRDTPDFKEILNRLTTKVQEMGRRAQAATGH